MRILIWRKLHFWGEDGTFRRHPKYRGEIWCKKVRKICSELFWIFCWLRQLHDARSLRRQRTTYICIIWTWLYKTTLLYKKNILPSSSITSCWIMHQNWICFPVEVTTWTVHYFAQNEGIICVGLPGWTNLKIMRGGGGSHPCKLNSARTVYVKRR